MIRRFSRVLVTNFATKAHKKITFQRITASQIATFNLNNFHAGFSTSIKYHFADYPKHQVLKMPALSPTMSQGKIVKWNKKVGDAVEEGDILCQVETDKATVGFEVTQNGFLAQKRETDQAVPVGTPLVVIVKKKQQVQKFSSFKFEGGSSKSQKKQSQPKQKKQAKQRQQTQQKQQKSDKPQKKQNKEEKSEQTQQKQPDTSNLPQHQQLKMPALSPTMTEGKIVKWNIKEGQQYSEGDALCDIETDKATVAFEATEKGYLAKILAKENSQMKVGDVLGVSVKKKQDASKFSQYKTGGSSKASPKKKPATEQKTEKSSKEQKIQKPQKSESQKQQKTEKSGKEGGRVFASPAAKTLAGQKKINLQDIGKGSGPDGRIIRQDVQGYKPVQKVKQHPKQKTQQVAKPAAKPKPQKIEIPENPYEQIPMSNMRKTIAARLTQSKTTIPHYYIKCNVEMDKITTLRNELNQNQKQNGVKISVNDIIVKAMALALRDYPNVNAQWHGNAVRKFKYADISVAVATEGGLITPIVYRADTLGLLDISRRTKDIAKRARQGKLDPREYIGGTTTVSNLGMFGIDSVISVINPPQSTILGVGKTQKKILFDQHSMNPDKQYRVAEVMELVVSADHRVVDGALAAQWVTRVKKYLQNPTNMLL